MKTRIDNLGVWSRLLINDNPMSEIQKLSEYQHARRRTEMYLSSRDPHTQTVIGYEASGPVAVEQTWVPALFVAFREIFDNALDEVITHGHGDRVNVHFKPETMTFVVEDNGRGIPITFDTKENKYLATMALSETRAGRNFDDETRGGSRGLNGVGASVVNFVSEYFQVDIERDKKSFSQRFSEGEEHIIEDPIIFPQKRKSKGSTGTRIEFRISKKVFSHFLLPESFIRARLYEAALCYPGIKLYYNDALIKSKSVEKDLFPRHKPIQLVIEQDSFKSQFWLVPDFFEDGREITHSLVNAIPVFNGGVHVDTFKKAFYGGLLKALEGMSKRKKLSPNRSDIEIGMLIYNITEMSAPHFDSQSKTRLINEGVGKIIQSAIDDPEFFKGLIRKNPEFIDRIYDRCANRTMKKDQGDADRLGKKNARSKVDSLVDAVGRDRSKCILCITEGESAKGGLVNKRNSQIHGVLPLRGKILNVNGQKMKTIIENEALSRIMASIGLIPGQRANRYTLRYGKVYFTCDSDEDGASIISLLTNFAYTLWPELFDPNKEPFFYSFETPLVIASKGKTTKYWYADDYEKFDSNLYSGWSVRRCKGLAALNEHDWEYALANPKLIPLIDDGDLKETLDMLFNTDRSDDRKKFMGI
jgi:DNA gyrase/topoisomerase IV subunit B